MAMTDEAKKALMAEARATAIEQSSKFITAPELSDRSGIDARNLTRGDADSDGYAAATYDADAGAVSDTAVPAPVEPVYTPPPPAALPEPENPENVGTGGGVFGMFQSGGSEEPKEKKFGLF